MLNWDTIQAAADAAAAKPSPLSDKWPYKPATREGFIEGAIWAEKQLQTEIQKLREKIAEYQNKGLS